MEVYFFIVILYIDLSFLGNTAVRERISENKGKGPVCCDISKRLTSETERNPFGRI